MMQFIIELPDVASIKEKRNVVVSLKERLRRKFKFSIAEVDLNDSLCFSQLGIALVTNSKTYGEGVLNKAVDFIEDNLPGRLHDVSIHTENF